MTVELATTSNNAFDICAARSNGALSAHRLMQIIKGASPVGQERFCFMAVLGHSSREHRVEMAIASGMSWIKFASRFQDLTGISKDRAHFATTLYPSMGEEYVEPIRLSA